MWSRARREDIKSAYLELLALVVARVHGVLAIARLAQQLPAINRKRRQVQRAVCVLHPLAMLPLHDATGTSGIRRVRDGAVVGLLVVAIRGERVGDAGALRLDELVVQGVEETLQRLVSDDTR